MAGNDTSPEAAWTIVCPLVRLWNGRPQPGGFRIFLSVGGSAPVWGGSHKLYKALVNPPLSS
jgi:hypothetical protein